MVWCSKSQPSMPSCFIHCGMAWLTPYVASLTPAHARLIDWPISPWKQQERTWALVRGKYRSNPKFPFMMSRHLHRFSEARITIIEPMPFNHDVQEVGVCITIESSSLQQNLWCTKCLMSQCIDVSIPNHCARVALLPNATPPNSTSAIPPTLRIGGLQLGQVSTTSSKHHWQIWVLWGWAVATLTCIGHGISPTKVLGERAVISSICRNMWNSRAAAFLPLFAAIVVPALGHHGWSRFSVGRIFDHSVKISAGD